MGEPGIIGYLDHQTNVYNRKDLTAGSFKNNQSHHVQSNHIVLIEIQDDLLPQHELSLTQRLQPMISIIEPQLNKLIHLI